MGGIHLQPCKIREKIQDLSSRKEQKLGVLMSYLHSVAVWQREGGIAALQCACLLLHSVLTTVAVVDLHRDLLQLKGLMFKGEMCSLSQTSWC